ncbi:MAG: hydroxyacid dehydrogenase [Bdellovibrionota bacterium]
MGRPVIVVSDGFDKSLFEQLKKMPELDVHPESKLSRDQVMELLPRMEGLIVRSTTKVDPALLDKAQKLKLVIRAGEGVDNIDVKYANTKGVKVANTPGANSNSAAEHAISLMFTVLRKTAWAHASMLRGEWEKTKFNGNEMAGKTVGFVGFGRIGQIVARRLAGFEIKVLFFDPVVKSCDLAYAKAASIEDVFKLSDIVTMHMPLMDSTRKMITEKYLRLMKKTAILINAARGGIVNEDDLFTCLKEGVIRGAGFDVFANEPLQKDSRLLILENIVLTPHLGASTDEAQFRVGEMAVNQIREFFVNNKLLNEVKA